MGLPKSIAWWVTETHKPRHHLSRSYNPYAVARKNLYSKIPSPGKDYQCEKTVMIWMIPIIMSCGTPFLSNARGNLAQHVYL
jgi:hypothetical protein